MHFSENVPRVHYLLLYGAHWRLLLSGVALWNRRGVTVHPWQPHAKSRDHPLFRFEQLLCCEPNTICGVALFAIRQRVTAMAKPQVLCWGFVAACAWFARSLMFLEYPQPRITVAVFAILLVGVAFAR